MLQSIARITGRNHRTIGPETFIKFYTSDDRATKTHYPFNNILSFIYTTNFQTSIRVTNIKWMFYYTAIDASPLLYCSYIPYKPYSTSTNLMFH